MKKVLGILVALATVLAFAIISQAACTQGVPTSTKLDLLDGIHLGTHTYKIAFFTDSATYGAATTAYSSTNEVSGTGYSAGGFTIADNGSTVPAPTTDVSGTSAYLTFTDLAPTTITFTAASTCYMIYNSTVSNKVVYVGTVTSVQPVAGTLTIDFPGSTPWLIKMD